jgi:tetratricopeptide (TPR) repeat protein
MNALGNLAVVYFLSGDVDRAEPVLRRALEVLDETVGLDHRSAAPVYWRLGVVYQEREDFARAELYFLEALEVYADGHFKPWPARYSTELGNLYCELGKPELAAPLLAEARTFYESRIEQAEIDDRRRIPLARLYLALGRMHDLRGEPETAHAFWERAAEQMQPMVSSEDLAPKRIFAEALLRLGRVDEARPLVEKLRNLGLRLPSFVRLCRDAGLPMDEAETPATP